MTCKHCGSSRHVEDRCPIIEKVDLMKMGIPPEHLFDMVITAEDIEESIELVKEWKAKRDSES